jgi:hypothetical protein
VLLFLHAYFGILELLYANKFLLKVLYIRLLCKIDLLEKIILNTAYILLLLLCHIKPFRPGPQLFLKIMYLLLVNVLNLYNLVLVVLTNMANLLTTVVLLLPDHILKLLDDINFSIYYTLQIFLSFTQN